MLRKVRRQRIAIDQLPKEMIAAMEAYLDWLTVRNYSNYTIVERRYYIGLFIEWAEQRSITAPHAVTLVILESYQRHVHHLRTEQGKPYSILGQRARLIAFRVRQTHAQDGPRRLLPMRILSESPVVYQRPELDGKLEPRIVA